MSREREKDGGRMVQLTLSNAVDQTQKIRVEVPAGTTVAQAALLSSESTWGLQEPSG